MKRQSSYSVFYKPEFDGIRAIAVFLTILAHTGYLRSYSPYGVDMFFVLSGFFAAEIFLQKKLSPKKFLFSRIARLYPLILLYSLFALLFAIRFKTPGVFGGFLASITQIKNFQGSDALFAHFWSLSAEFQFYFIITLMVILWKHQRVYWFTIPMVIFLIVNFISQAFLPFTNPNHWSTYNRVIARPSEIWMGILAYKLCQSRFNRYPKLSFTTMILFMFLFVWLKDPLLLAICTFSLVIYLESAKDSLIKKFLGFSAMKNLGILSFSIYIWHILIANAYEVSYIHFFRKMPQSHNLLAFSIIFFPTLFISYFSYNYFEMPMKRSLTRKFATMFQF